jgi:hypothetical protein
VAKDFDSASKEIAAYNTPEFASFVGALMRLSVSGSTSLNTDLSKTMAADTALRVHIANKQMVLHTELQAGYDSDLPSRLRRYNVALVDREGVYVRSIALLLRREANASNLTGELSVTDDVLGVSLYFRYDVIRLWELPFEAFLNGPASLLPLGMLTDEAAGNLQANGQRVIEQIRHQQPDAGKQRNILTGLFFLAGMRYNESDVNQLLSGIKMEESVTYQATIRKGREIGHQEGFQKGHQEGLEQGEISASIRWVIKLGTKLFGAPSQAHLDQLHSITTLDATKAIEQKIDNVTSWDELLK